MKDFCRFVDVFYGNGEVDHFSENGLASKWYYIKALCGNTVPHATLPFGKMSVGAYSGGYPTGYGNHYPNSCGGIKKLFGGNMAFGFSHLHQSGTGAIKYYYNYAVTTPFSGELADTKILFPIENETAYPGYYSCRLNNRLCEFTVSGGVALHHYRFNNRGGRIAIDFSNNGLHPTFGDWGRGEVKEADLRKVDGNKIYFSALMSGVRLYFCARFESELQALSLFKDLHEIKENAVFLEDGSADFGAVADVNGLDVYLKIAYSTHSFEAAEKSINEVKGDFNEVREQAYNIWNEALGRINLTSCSTKIKKRFYSNLYHSLVKPVDMTGESILGVGGDCVSDLATMWDQYKTVYPLIFMLYPEMGEKLMKGIANISRTMNKLPCSFGTSDVFPCEEQAKMLGVIALIDAYHFGVKGADTKLVDECILRELDREDFRPFLENGIFERYTHILDAADACFNAMKITENKELAKRLEGLAENFKNAYGEDGLMSESSPYYEGDRYTYSFRLHPYMEKRIELAGGKERFVSLLDDFFGFGKESVRQITEVGVDPAKVAQHHRFEGFNNECDMETPYAYIYADRNDRTCEIIHASVTDSFLSGRGGLPGNNDSGGLSSCYVWNVLGLFPAAGNGELLIGSPHINKAAIMLSNGNKLTLKVKGNEKGEYITESAVFNGRPIKDFRISASELMQGGTLEFNMK